MNYQLNQGVYIKLRFDKSSQKQTMMPNQLGYGYYGPNSTEVKSSSTSYDRNYKTVFSNVAITSKKANKVLDVCQDKQTKGMLIIYQDYKQTNQRFDIVQVGDFVNIISKQNGKYLTVAANSQSNGAPIFQEPSAGLIGQKFRLAYIQKNQYFIHTFCGKVLDCCEQKTSNGTRVIQFTCQRSQHQKWVIN